METAASMPPPFGRNPASLPVFGSAMAAANGNLKYGDVLGLFLLCSLPEIYLENPSTTSPYDVVVWYTPIHENPEKLAKVRPCPDLFH
jgi:hypothetical protein